MNTRTVRTLVRKYLKSNEDSVPDDLLAKCLINNCMPSEIEGLKRQGLFDDRDCDPEFVCTVSSLLIEESEKIDEEEGKNE